MAGKTGGKTTGTENARRRSHPAPLRGARSAGLVAAWAGALFCGWHTAAPAGSGPAPGTRVDLLAPVLHGAAAWVGLTVLWLSAITACERIIRQPGVQGFRSSGSDGADRSDGSIGSGLSDRS